MGGAGVSAFSSKWGRQRRLPGLVFYEYLISSGLQGAGLGVLELPQKEALSDFR